MNIQKLSIEDIDTILEFDEYYLTSPSRKETCIRAVESNSLFWVIVDGIIVWYAIFSDYGFLEESFVYLIVIAKESQRKWYAKQAIEYFESITKAPRLHISTNTSNIPMQNFLNSLWYIEWWIIKSIDKEDPEIFYYKTL